MKTISKFLSAFVTLIIFALPLLAACSSSDDNEPPVQFKIPGVILASGINFEQASGTSSFNVESPQIITAKSSDESWCTVTCGTRTNNTTPVTVSVTENTVTTERTAKITIFSGSQARTVSVKQKAYVNNTPTPEPSPVEGKSAMEIAKEMGMGWNLGNHFDGHSNGIAGTYWDNAQPTQALFDRLKELGFNSVRIPVTWMGRFGSAPDYKIDSDYINEVGNTVRMAVNAGLYAVINIHHDGADSKFWLNIKDAAKNETKNNEVKANISAIWKQIAEYFADYDQHVIFESFNEIHDGGWGWGENRNDGGKQYSVLNEWNQTFVDAVRSTGGKNASRVLGVPSYCANPDYATDGSLVLPKDPSADRLMVSVHYYAPVDYTLNAKFSEWGHTGDKGKKDSWGDEDYVRDTFGKLNSKFVKNNIPVYVGELGNINRNDERADAFRRYYLEYICKAAKEYGLVPMLWDNNAPGYGAECHGTLNHNDGSFVNKWAENVVKTITNAVNNNDASYTLDSVYANAPK